MNDEERLSKLEDELKSIREQMASKKMSEDEKSALLQDYRDKNFEDMLFAQRRTSELHDQFTSLEVQIATVLLAFAAIFLEDFSTRIEGLDIVLVIVLKLMYIASVLSLVASLGLGLVHLLRKERFWDEHMAVRLARLKNLGQYLTKKKSYEETLAYDEGTSACKPDIVRSPKWTWILQTVALFFAVGLIVALFSVLLFVG